MAFNNVLGSGNIIGSKPIVGTSSDLIPGQMTYQETDDNGVVWDIVQDATGKILSKKPNRNLTRQTQAKNDNTFAPNVEDNMRKLYSNWDFLNDKNKRQAYIKEQSKANRDFTLGNMGVVRNYNV